MQVEKRLLDLSREIDESHNNLMAAESKYHVAKAKYEIDMARSRMNKSHPDFKLTAVQREDDALLDNAEQHMSLAISEAEVKAARANTARLKIQVEIARSVGTSVRTSMDLT